MLMPRLFFEELGGFDETFFMYGEDVDLCFRVKEAGKKVIYFADASITHLKAPAGCIRNRKRSFTIFIML
jgi:GT2 family glycosyltransferase